MNPLIILSESLRSLQKKDQRLIGSRVDALAKNPRPPGIEALRGEKDLYRLRAGDYRIIYRIQDRALVVLVLAIGHRREVYRTLKR